MQGELDFVVYKIKFWDGLPIPDMNSKVSTRALLIIFIQRYSNPLNNAVKTDFEAPETLISVAVVVPPM